MYEKNDDTLGPPASTQESTTAANKALVLEFFERAIIGGDYDAADEYMRPDYIQHNPKAAGGLEGFKAYFKKLGERMRRMRMVQHHEINHVVAEGDLVVVFASTKLKGIIGTEFKYADLFRVQDGLLAEHWDVLQGKSLLNHIIMEMGSG